MPLPTGVFAYCDEIAFGALQHLNRAGVDVPGQVSLVGVDNHPFAETAGLSTYDQAIEEQGRLAGRAVIALLEGHQPDVSLHEVDSNRPRVRFRSGDSAREIECDIIAGCDGSHGVSRGAIPSSACRVFERTYPFAWLGILAEVPPSLDELIYAHHDRGFALHSMRTPSITRLYVQCDPDDGLDIWPDERIWDELRARLQKVAVDAYRALRVRDYGRVDLRLTDTGDIYVLEVNASCYLEKDSEFAMAAGAAGLDYPRLIERIVDLALARRKGKK